MILPRCAAVLLATFLLAAALVGQSPAPVAPFADDDRAARVAERYQSMLAANPSEGMALDRLWKMYEERNATAFLIDIYRRITDASDKPADALVYGHLLKRAGRLDEAAGSYERASRLDSASPLPLVAQADLATVRSKPAEAAALLEKALDKTSAADRRRGEFLLKLGDAWLAAGQPLKAGDAWEKLVAADPANLALRKQLASTYEKNGLPERAIVHYQYIVQHADPPGRATALRELGRLHEIRGEFEASRDALESGLALTARDNWLYGELQKSLIRLYQRAGKAAELDTRWKAVVERAPRDLGGYLRLVALAEAQGDPAAARLWLEKLVALAPRDRKNILKLAYLLRDAGENERAAALYDVLLKLQPGNLDLILARADLDLQMGRTADAAARVESRTALNPADESVSIPALQFFLSSRLDDSALKLLSSAVARQPTALEPVLALAKFLFGHGRPADARSALERFTQQPGDPSVRAQRWTAAADCYKDAGQPDEALRCWREALAMQPQAGPALLAVGELLLAKGDVPGGTAQMELAIASAPEGTARIEIERKLFQALLDRSSPDAAAPVPRRPGVFSVTAGSHFLIVPPSAPAAPSGTDDLFAKAGDRPLLRYLENMDRAAREKPTAAAYLRLARWLQWAHRLRDAGLAADAALGLEPDSIPAREILADTAAAQHNRGAAIKRLAEIATLDRTRKPTVTKRIADLLLEDSEFDGALALLDRLAQEAPGSVEALTDLALGQQRADRWFDALATWERAYALPRLTPVQRANLRQPMVSAYEHLGEFGRAAGLLQAAVETQNDPAARQDLFRELVAFCQIHSLSPWLEGVYKDRLAAQPQDYFAMTALAELQKAAGDPHSAYRLLEQAYYSAPDPAAALRTLVTEAETLAENEEAVAHQRRLVGLPGQATAENLEHLAALEEANTDDEAAGKTWEQIAARFSRDTSALGAAADYFAKLNRVDRSRDLLTRIVALAPDDYRRGYQLAQLDVQTGNFIGARAGLEAVLANTRAEMPGDALLLPQELDPATEPSAFMAAAGRTSAHAPTGTPDPAVSENGERNVRLKAIGQLSRLMFAGEGTADADARRRWLDRWHAAAATGSRSEPLAAFFYAGQKDAVSDLTTAWLTTPDHDDLDRAEQIFLLAGLRMENYPPLTRWVRGGNEAGSAERISRLGDILQYFLSTGGRPSPQMVAQLFPADIRSRALLWRMASGVFADKRWYPQAVEIGERAVALPGGSMAAEAFQLAQWELDVGRTDSARELLRRAVEESDGTAFDGTANNAVFADLRAYYFLLPASERTHFVTGYLQRVNARGGNLVHATLAAVLLHGLEGDESAACRSLDRIVEMCLLDGRQGAESADLRRWNYLFACGTQLQAWNLDKLAAYAWRRGLASASASDQRDPEVHNVLGEIRLHQLVAEVISAADPQEVCERVTEYLRERPPIIAMAAAASVLLNAGQHAAAIQIYERLRREAPADADYPRAMLLAEEASGDLVSTRPMLNAMLDGSVPIGDITNRFDFMAKSARLSENSGDFDAACRQLLDARRMYPHSLPVLRALAQTLERSQKFEDAAAIWREAIGCDRGVTSLQALASVEIARGRREEAFVLARDAKEPSSESEQAWWLGQRVSLYLATGHAGEAVDLCWKWVRDGRTDGLTQAVSRLAEHDQRAAARDLLVAAVRGTRDPSARFQLQRALVQCVYTQRDTPTDDFVREMRRLEQFTAAAPGQRLQYASDRYAFAVARGATAWLETALQTEWDEGRGEVEAGSQLADLCIETKRWDALQKLVSLIDARPNLPELTLYSLATRLINAGHAPWALAISERLCRRFPQNSDYAVTRARVFWQSGQRDEAIRVLDILEAQGAFQDNLSGDAARLYVEMGDRGRAIASLERTTALDPFAVRSAAVHCRLATLYIQEGRLDDACRLLKIAYRNPAQADMGPLVDYLDAAGNLEGNVQDGFPGDEMPLTFFRRAQLLEAICLRLVQTDRGAASFRLAAAHPELLSSVPSLAGTLRRDCKSEQIPALAKLLADAIRLADGPPDSLKSEFARLNVRRAELAAADQPARRGEALNFLTQAHELRPDDFAVARPLAVAFREQHQDARATAVLKAYLQEDALPTERAAARQLLGLK